jgi:hypothetical protein
MRIWNQSRQRVRLVVFGRHSPDWMEALAPQAPLWKELPDVQEVVQVAEAGHRIPYQWRWGRPTVVLPLMEDHVATCPRQYRALVPSAEALRILRDKAGFARYARQNGLASYTPTVFRSLEEATFPCVVKRTDLNSGQGVEIARSRAHAEALLSRHPFAGKPYIVQSLVVHSGEYVAHCVCKDGNIVWHRVMAYPHDGVAAIRRTGAPRRELSPLPQIAELEAFLKPLAYSGPCNIDYTIGDDGHVVVFEINPRLGGSLMRPEHVADLRDCLSCIVRHAA